MGIMIMKTWNDFKSNNSNFEGARAAFERVCADLCAKEYAPHNVQSVRANPGDGGVDIFIGEIGVEPIIVVQCKFFLDKIDRSQMQQIDRSFNKARSSCKYKLKEWILFIPKELDIKENILWSKWKEKQSHVLPKDFIKLFTGDKLISLLKKHDLYNKWFNMDTELKIAEMYEVSTHTNQDESLFSINSNNFEKSVIKMSYAKCKDMKLSEFTKKRCFDTTLLALFSEKKQLEKNSIHRELKMLGITASDEKIQGSLSRLSKEIVISGEKGLISIKKSVINQITAVTDIEALKEWVINEVKKRLNASWSDLTIKKVNACIENTLFSYFRDYAYNISFENYNTSLESTEF